MLLCNYVVYEIKQRIIYSIISVADGIAHTNSGSALITHIPPSHQSENE